jgi:hypothetical protein
LNDSHIQALADGEGDGPARAHAAACPRCQARVEERQELMEAITRAIVVPAAMPTSTASRVEEIFRLTGDTQAVGNPRGATRLLAPGSPGSRLQAGGRRGWLYGSVGVVAATVVAVLFVAPLVRTPDATLSASAILAKSASQLSATVTGGIELLEYELVLDGVPKELMPDGADGTYHVKQAIDHNVGGRFRFASYGPDGRMLTSIAQDPQANRRVMAFTVDGQPYRFEVSLPANDAGMSLPEMERLHMEASITMMQASGNQLVETIDGPQGKLYRIEVPRVSGPGTSPVWDLSEARVLIDARDYRVTEFAVSGSFLKQGYSLSYKLISHSVVGSVAADTFRVPAQPGQIVIDGEGSHVPAHDVVMLSLRELTKLKQGR